MALETLRQVGELAGFPVIVMDELREKYPEKFNEGGQMDWEWFESEIRPNYFIYVRNDVNSLSFTIQNGPVKEAGVNGCQVDSILAGARAIIAGLNEKFPCRENSLALTKIDEALHWLNARTANREKRGVEGTNQA